MERQLQAPFRIEPVESMPLTLEQAHTFLHHFLSNQPPEDSTTKAYLSRLEGGLKRDLEVQASLEIPLESIGKKAKKSKKRQRDEVEEYSVVESNMLASEEPEKIKKKRKKKDKTSDAAP